ncbi:hypothetical protein J1614_000368, partial [Plenodomus biglobosus]
MTSPTTTDSPAHFRYAQDPSYNPTPLTQPPFQHSSPLHLTAPHSTTTNLVFKYGDRVLVRDMRCSAPAGGFTLETHGFEVVRHDSGFDDWEDREAVEGRYLGEVEGLVRRVLGVGLRVRVYDWRVRRGVGVGGGVGGGSGGGNGEENGGIKYARPLRTLRMVLDQTVRGMVKRVRHCMGSEAEELLKGRVRMVNLWRPLHHPPSNWPLALCDATTVSPTDLIPTSFITPNYVGEMYNVMYHPDHTWYYLSQQEPDEVLLFKIADSRTDVRAKYCPHASFWLEGEEREGVLRESIEVRVLVFGGE